MTTARLLTQGVSPSSLLGAPGPFVVDREEGRRVFGRFGTEHVVRAQVAGYRWPFMRSVEEGVGLLLRHVHLRMEEHTGVGILISHDAIVMPVVSWIAGHLFEENWLSPLDGLVFAPGRGGGLDAWWLGRHAEVQP